MGSHFHGPLQDQCRDLRSRPGVGESTGGCLGKQKKGISIEWILMMFKVPSLGHLVRCSKMTVIEYDL